MANENIQITVREDGSTVVKRNLADIGATAERSAEGVDILKRALEGLAVLEVVRELIQMTNEFQTMQNRIRTVTDSAAELTVVQAALLKIADATRQSYEGTVETYQRVALGSKSLGASQNQVLAFTSNLNKAIAVSGTNSIQAKNGMIQLGEAMQAGTLQGQHLRALMFDLPIVGKVLADSLGVTVGQLKKMGAEGKLTSQALLDAFDKPSKFINDKFGKLVPTLSQAFTVLKNNVIQAVGQFAVSSGLTKTFTYLLLVAANNTDTLGRAFLGLSIIIAVNFATYAIGAAIKALAALGVAALSNPFTAILEVLLILIATLVVLSDKIQIGGKHIGDLQDLWAAGLHNMEGNTSDFIKWFNTNFPDIAKTFEDTTGKITLNSLLTRDAKDIDHLIGFFIGANKAIEAAFDGLPFAVAQILANGINIWNGLIQGFVNGVVDAANVVNSVVGSKLLSHVNIAPVKAAAGSYAQSIGDAFKDGLKFSGAEDSLNQLFSDADKIAAVRKAKDNADAAAQAKALADLDKQGTKVPTPDPDAKSKIKAYDAARNALIALLAKIDPVRDGLLKLAKDNDTLTKAQKFGIITTQEQAKYLAELKVQSDQDILGPILEKADPVRAALTDLATLEKRLTAARAAGLVTGVAYTIYLARLKKSFEDATDPAKKFNDELKFNASIMGESAFERQLDIDTRTQVLALQQKGVFLTAAETQALKDKLRTQADSNEAQAAQDKLLADSIEKRRQFQVQLKALSQVTNSPTNGGFNENDKFSAANNLVGGNLDGTQGAIDAQLSAYRTLYAQIKQLRQNNLIDEETANQALAQLDSKIQTQRLSGQSKFLTETAQLQTSKNRELAAIGKAAAIAQATIDGIRAVQAALVGPPGPPWSCAIAGVTAAVTAANVAQIAGINIGFQGGGYTGNGGASQVAGVVHGQEFVFDAAATRRIGVQNLESLRGGTGSPAQASSSSGNKGTNVSVKQYPGVAIQVNHRSDSEIEIIATQAVRKHAPTVVAQDMTSNPNGRTSKAVSQAFGIRRGDR